MTGILYPTGYAQRQTTAESTEASPAREDAKALKTSRFEEFLRLSDFAALRWLGLDHSVFGSFCVCRRKG
ncbi:hypothetical protein, partial [Mycobacterium asiaticum]|uniref:hypothetical protein n=1 Tax=Mycobacterium asiaticum TaxID=1790 RepID=UPI001C12C687